MQAHPSCNKTQPLSRCSTFVSLFQPFQLPWRTIMYDLIELAVRSWTLEMLSVEYCCSECWRPGAIRPKLHYTDTGYEHQQRTPPTDKKLPHPNIFTCRDVGLWHCDMANLLYSCCELVRWWWPLVVLCMSVAGVRAVELGPKPHTCIVSCYYYNSVAPPPPEIFASQKHQNFGAISHNFATWSRISPERNKTSSIGKRRCKLFSSVYFGPQTAKNRTGVVTHPTGGHQAGHCHASSFNRICCTNCQRTTA